MVMPSWHEMQLDARGFQKRKKNPAVPHRDGGELDLWVQRRGGGR